MKKHSKSLFAGFLVLSMLLCVICAMTPVAFAQSSNSDNSGDGSSVSSDDSSSRPQHVSDVLPDPVDIRTGQALPAGKSPLHWGKLSVVSFSLLDAYSVDNLNYQTGSTENVNSAGLNALLSYDIRRSGFNFNVQYQPMVYFTDGDFQSELSNQRFNLSTSRRIGLWTLQFTDNFYYLPANGQAAFGMANGQWVNGAGQNVNLISGEKTLGNAFGVSTQRSLNERDQLTLGADYQYYRITGIPIVVTDPSLGTTESTQNTFGFNVGLDHRMGWRSSIGVAYDFARNNYSQLDGTIATVGNYNAITATYSFQPTRTIKIVAGAGPAWLSRPGSTGDKSVLSFQANFSVTKTMRRSSISFLYGRNNSFNGVIANSLSEYVDLSLARSISRKFSVSAGGGYARQLAEPTSQGGWHGYAQLSYNLTRRWALFGGFSALSQRDIRSIYGNSTPKYASFGLTWSWGQSEDHN